MAGRACQAHLEARRRAGAGQGSETPRGQRPKGERHKEWEANEMTTKSATIDHGPAGQRLSRRSSLLALGGIGSALVTCGPGGAPASGPAAAASSQPSTGAPRRLRIGTSFVVTNLV